MVRAALSLACKRSSGDILRNIATNPLSTPSEFLAVLSIAINRYSFGNESLRLVKNSGNNQNLSTDQNWPILNAIFPIEQPKTLILYLYVPLHTFKVLLFRQIESKNNNRFNRAGNAHIQVVFL
jgi:hypothetical protein